MFVKPEMGDLLDIRGSDPLLGDWAHRAFVPRPLPDVLEDLAAQTYFAVADARAALAALDSTARQLPNPRLLRLPALRLEAQSTSELEGTYAPLADVLTADEDEPGSEELAEILNYVVMATSGFASLEAGWPISVPLVAELQGTLMRGTRMERQSGRIRDTQVVIGRRPGAAASATPVEAARFVPAPPGAQLEGAVRDLFDWMRVDHSGRLDPVMAAAIAHYQFETLHPFTDGNGRVGRFLIVAQLLSTGVLREPTLTVSPWFEARRTEYYDRLLGVSARGEWDLFIQFFAAGLEQAAKSTRAEMLELVGVQAELHDRIRASSLRAENAHALVDLALANPSFTVRVVESALGVSYVRANRLVGQLVELEILKVLDPNAYRRRFFAPSVLSVLTRRA